ncbi:MAG TPA: lactate utilization protein [Methanotrichaceae archaeon]|nr:lactate utilization protein [Methanotrichaceae archaeon]
MGRATKYSAVNLLPELNVDANKWSRMPSGADIASTVQAIEARGIKVLRVKDGGAALEKIKEIIPSDAEVMNGSSTTLIEIGFDEFLNAGQHGWKDFHKVITSEDDKAKRNDLRRKAVAAEYFLSGVNAIAMTGELVSCDATGSRVGAWPFAAKSLILVAGVNKVVPTLEDALRRIREYAYPLEDARARKASGTPSRIGKCVILASERQSDRVTLILIDDKLGY